MQKTSFLFDLERDMSGKEENRIFVGGLSWDITERQLENAFDRFGKIVECQGKEYIFEEDMAVGEVGNGHDCMVKRFIGFDSCRHPRFMDNVLRSLTEISIYTELNFIEDHIHSLSAAFSLLVKPEHYNGCGKIFQDGSLSPWFFLGCLLGGLYVIMLSFSENLDDYLVPYGCCSALAQALKVFSIEEIDNSLSFLVHKALSELIRAIHDGISDYVMLERDTGRPRGFGFITFADHRAMDDAIREMHGRDFGDRVISVNKAQPKMGGDDSDHGYRGGYSTGSRGGYGGGDRPAGQDECFKCGRSGHWARDCPSAGGRGSGGGLLSSRSRFGGAGDRGDRFGGDRDRYMDDRYDGGRYGDRDRFDSRDNKYGGRDRYASDRYPTNGDRFAGDRFSGSDRYAQNGKDRGYDRDDGPRGGNDRYGGSGGPSRNDRSYKSRPGPYDHRPSRGRRPSSFERY
ncbi:hypothetical protein DKX38_012209 [Salix brachista]|uniref:CCHC-type domain-containing protein n=1 Tax=Salix brachista TaxID=2182728 RepID=A0A5N5LMY7_9ROSI|nr:hypothetical protein DKX38_012209 [Salix brachista]